MGAYCVGVYAPAKGFAGEEVAQTGTVRAHSHPYFQVYASHAINNFLKISSSNHLTTEYYRSKILMAVQERPQNE